MHESFSDWEHRLKEKCLFLAVDNMSKLPCVIDATSHLFARNRGHTLVADNRNQYDHNIVVGQKLLVETTGIAMCKSQPYKELTDDIGRPRLPRSKTFAMCDYIRGVPYHIKGTAQAVHFRDIRDALKTLPDGELPSVLCICGDNGYRSGFDPTDPVNQHYAGELTRDFPNVMAVCLISYAAGESSMNVLIERPWSQHKKAVVGLRLGLYTFLEGERRAPTSEELLPFFECVGKELKDVWEVNVNVAEAGDVISAPKCEFVGPLSQQDRAEAERVHKFFNSKTLKVINDPENADLLKKARRDNKNTFQSFNCTWTFDPECDREALFGVTKRPLMPERFQLNGRSHYSTYLQKKEKYTSKAQDGYVMPATQGAEQTLQCCDRVFRSHAALQRHIVINHRNRKPRSKRKRPSKVGYKRRVAPCIVQASPRQVAAQLEEPESEEVEDDLDAELEDVHVCVAEMDQDVSAEGDEDDDEEEEAEKCEHKGIIGAVAVSGRQYEPSEFFIRYPKET